MRTPPNLPGLGLCLAVVVQNLTLPNTLRRLVSANMGQARPGSLMLDPFAGTGSIMLAAAHFGAATWGGEIHPPMLRGKRKGLNVRSASPTLFLCTVDSSHRR